MHPGVLSCDPDASVTDPARIMATNHVHSLAVVAPDQDWLIVTDLDLVKAGIQRGEQTARTIARRPMLTVEPAQPLLEAAQLMLSHNTSHALVVEPRTNRPVGVISTLDLAGVLAWGEA
jgi:CBS domain-containing protein